MTSDSFSGDEPCKATRLDGLDALRGIAALLVTVMHIQHVNGSDDAFVRSYLAVDVFFVLSGYVIARTYEPKFARGMRLRDFGMVRLKRLWPTMCIGAMLGLATSWSEMSPLISLTLFVLAALFVPLNTGHAPQFPTNPPAWSIVLELLANLIHFAGLRFLGVRALVLLAASCAVFLIGNASHMSLGNVDALGLARVLFSYSAGIIIWRTCGEKALLPGWLGLAGLPFIILLLGLVPGSPAWLDFVFVFLFCPAIVISGLSPLRVGRKVLTFLGAISFPLYAIHFPLAIFLGRAGYGIGVVLPLTIIAAWLVFRATGQSSLPKDIRPPLPA